MLPSQQNGNDAESDFASPNEENAINYLVKF